MLAERVCLMPGENSFVDLPGLLGGVQIAFLTLPHLVLPQALAHLL